MSSFAAALSMLMSHASAAARMTARRRMTNSTGFCCVDKADESGFFFG
jgi:hypothetical protein